MGDYIFLFDLDSTITAREILPEISRTVGKEKAMREITEKTMQGIVPFKESFLRRVELLKDVPVTEVNQMVAEIPLNEHIAEFIRENHDRCYVVTGNLDIWISGLMKRLDMKGHYYCSKASVTENRIDRVNSVLDKQLTTQQFVQPAVAVGDGDNDADMARLAHIGIGFGGVREIAPALLQTIDYAFLDDRLCADFLRKLL